MRTEQTEERPAEVPTAKQAGETNPNWGWAEPMIWTERMLAALENGVKGGKWFSLIDKVYSERTLRAAFKRVKSNKGSAGVDHQTIEMFEKRLDENVHKLSTKLRDGAYAPQRVRRAWVPKPGRKEKRPLGIPTIRDRIVQTAIRMVIEPIFELEFAEQSYGFRPGRGCKDALRRVTFLLKQGYVHVVDADIRDYFGNIQHNRLMQLVEEKISDGRLLSLIRSYLTQEVMDSASGWVPDTGTPQGAVVSPLLSNIYLNHFDHEMRAAGYEVVRYADDWVVLCKSEEEAQRALTAAKALLDKASLELHPEKTRIVDATQRSFDFLGYRFKSNGRWPSDKALKKYKDTIRTKTRRANGHSLSKIISNVNASSRGWFEYFKHSRHHIFKSLDGWTRNRIRAILRHRRNMRGKARGRDYQRWNNAFFAEQGLFSMQTAFESASQSSKR